MASPKTVEPMPRCYHTSVQVANKIVVYSGRTLDDSEQTRKRLASVVEVFNPYSEGWKATQSKGETPVNGVCGGASASLGDHLFTYGGKGDDGKFLDTLHQLSTKDYKWRELSFLNSKCESPMPKQGAAMVACGGNLALFGGYGIPHSHAQSGSSFIKNTFSSDGSGYTNEFHIYHLDEGMSTCNRYV